jgi:hypothetical protein
MHIEDHPHFLHSFKNRIIHLITFDPAFRVGSDTTRIRFNAYDACCFCFVDLGGGEVWGEVEGHQELGGGVYGLESLFIGEGLGGCCYWGFEVRLEKKLVPDDGLVD